jgi:hypothetical protein
MQGCRESKLSCWLDAEILSTLGVTNGLRIFSTPYYGHSYNGEQGFVVDSARYPYQGNPDRIADYVILQD